MTRNFDECNHPEISASAGQETQFHPDESTPELSALLKRDRFELLSAYLDGEVTAAERKRVESWLASDPTTQRLYTRLLLLRQGLRNLPVPSSPQPVEQVVQEVSARIDRRPKRLLWGGLALAALFVGAVAGTLPRGEYVPSLARSSQGDDVVPSAGLMIALNHPPIEIPKAATTTTDVGPYNSEADVQ